MTAPVRAILFTTALCIGLILLIAQGVDGKGIIALENTVFTIPKCPNGTAIRATESRWGVDCGCTCDTYYTNMLVRAQCDGLATCSFNVTSQYFGDLLNCGAQFVGRLKTLVVIYDCILSYN